jgi:hypothetical protein
METLLSAHPVVVLLTFRILAFTSPFLLERVPMKLAYRI